MALKIGDLGRATGTKVETIRYYERIGLLPKPSRSAANYRAYGQKELHRLSFIRRARDLGFSLDQIRALLGLADNKDNSCATVDAIARDHLASVERKIADLQALGGELSAMLAQCSRGTVADCHIIEALSPVQA